MSKENIKNLENEMKEDIWIAEMLAKYNITEKDLYELEGITGENCAIAQKYSGSDKKLLAKGYIPFGGLSVLRGFAPLKVLANISISNCEDYQREENESHTKEIKDFLNNGKTEAKFLPEIILSVTIPKKVFLEKFKIDAKVSKTVAGSIDNLNYYRLVTIKQALARVDGNHRLEAGKDSDLIVPFAIVLWDKTIWDDEERINSYDTSINIESEAFLFYFLNNTAQKLELEENYKGLVKSKNWTSEELTKVNAALPLLKHFNEKWLSSPIFKCPYLESNPLSQIGTILNEIFNTSDEVQLTEESFDDILHQTIDILKQTNGLNYIKNTFDDIVAQLVFYAIYNKIEDESPQHTLVKIDKWCKKYKYSNTVFTNAKKLYDVSVKQITTKKVNVFVAMPYYSEDIVKHYNDIFSNACAKIIDEGSSVEIDTYSIMKFKGGTFDLEEDIMDKINNCDIFVADISKSNPNVMYELGIAAKAGKPVMILKKNGDKAKIPSDIILKFQVRFNECMDLNDKIYENLKAILQEEFLAVFPK